MAIFGIKSKDLKKNFIFNLNISIIYTNSLTVEPCYNIVVGVHDSGSRCTRGALGVPLSATRMGGKTTGVKERGVGETGWKEKGVGETGGKTTGLKERGVGETRAKEWEVG